MIAVSSAFLRRLFSRASSKPDCEPVAWRTTSRRPALCVLPLVALLSLSAQGQAVRGGPLPQPLPLFPSNNWWNTDITNAPVDSNSASFITFIATGRGMHPDFGGDAVGSGIYGMPYITVGGAQPLVPVVFDYADESDYGAPGRPAGYPIPPEAKTETKWIEGGLAGSDPAASGDRHMLIVDRDNRLLYELFALRWNVAMNRWEAGSGAIFPLDANLRRPDTWTSADAAGLAILPGLVRYDESYGSAPIRHAFRVTVRATNGYVYPASHRAGSTSGALPMGARLRLKAGKDISGYSEPLRRIFQAMKTYGLIVADNGSDMYVSGAYDTRWNNDILNPAFRSLTASDFEVIQLGWRPEFRAAPVDFDRDEVSDAVLYRKGAWISYPASSGVWTGQTSPACIPAPGDFDGDGRTDYSMLCNGAWHFFTRTGAYMKGIWTGGVSGDVPAVADYDGDGSDDVVVYRNGAWIAYDFATSARSWSVWTGPGAGSVPLPMDHDGDGRADLSVYSNGAWHFYHRDGRYLRGIWTGGVPGDIPVPGNYDGDGDEEPVIFRGGAWIFFSVASGLQERGVWTGASGFRGAALQPAPLDYDGDGALEFTIYAGGPWHFYRDDGTYFKGLWTGGVEGDMALSRRSVK